MNTNQPDKKEIRRLVEKGGLADARRKCEHLLQDWPDDLEGWFLLAAICGELGDYSRSEECLRHVLSSMPTHGISLYNLGVILIKQDRVDEAETVLRKAEKYAPNLAQIPNELGQALHSRNMIKEAAECFQRALTVEPGNAAAHNNLGLLYNYAGNWDAALAHFLKALEANDNLAGVHANIGGLYRELGNIDKATRHLERAISLDPDFADPHITLGYILLDQCAHRDALHHYREALRLDPAMAPVFSNLLLCMNYMPEFSAEQLFEEHKVWAQHYEQELLASSSGVGCRARMGDRLRIGFVSPDFRNHPVGLFIEPALRCHNPGKVSVYCYSDVNTPDMVTARLRGYPEHWCDIKGWNDERVAQKIRDDCIDILVDLAGHTAYNRLFLFARRPAPVQVTYLGYLNTTGMTSIDYRLTDRWEDPEGGSSYLYTEKLVRLPGGFLCYSEEKESPAAGELPAKQAGHITFGCFNNASKLNARVISVWSDILKAVPGATLLLKSKQLGYQQVRNRLEEQFSSAGVDLERLEFQGPSSRADYLGEYNRVDIGLDPFPYCGGMVTCQALWMGVPVVSLAGKAGFARTGASILSSIGLEELVQESEAGYRECAVSLAGDPSRLAELRQGMRRRMQVSTLMDAEQFARSLEDAFAQLWENRCGNASSARCDS